MKFSGEILGQRFNNKKHESRELVEIIDFMRSKSRGKGIARTDGVVMIEDDPVLAIHFAVVSGMLNIMVEDWKPYAFNEDGLTKAIADIIHTVHGGQEDYLHLYQRLLGI